MSDLSPLLEATLKISNIRSSSTSSDRKTTLLYAKFSVYFPYHPFHSLILTHNLVNWYQLLTSAGHIHPAQRHTFYVSLSSCCYLYDCSPTSSSFMLLCCARPPSPHRCPDSSASLAHQSHKSHHPTMSTLHRGIVSPDWNEHCRK